MRQNRDPALRISIQKPQDKFVDQRCFSRAARPGETDDGRVCDLRFGICDFDTLRSPLRVWCSTFSFPDPVGLFDIAKFVREFLIKGLGARPFCSRFAVTPMNKFDHVVE